MARRIGVLIICALFMANLYGCVAVVAGTAGGAGTATWLSGKLVESVDASLEKSLQAVKSALASLELRIDKETKKTAVIQVKSEYTDGRTIWIDIHKITEKKSRIEVRVGLISSREAAQKIMDKINANL